jgi:hypothetical protein
MKPMRTAGILILAFLFGGSGAELAVRTKRALDRHAEQAVARDEGGMGELVALQIQRADGEVVARPRLIAAAGRSTRLVLRDPENPAAVRLTLRVETTREASGDLTLRYELSMPSEALQCSGRVSVTPGAEQALDLGEHALSAVVFAIPVPSAEFDAYLEAERRGGSGVTL